MGLKLPSFRARWRPRDDARKHLLAFRARQMRASRPARAPPEPQSGPSADCN